MNTADNEKLSLLEAEARSIEDSLVSAAIVWATTQATLTSEFLREEARITVMNQSPITEQLANDIPALKAEVQEIRNKLVAKFDQWCGSVDSIKAMDLAQNPRKVFLELTQEAHRAFGDSFMSRGYDPGSRSRGLSDYTPVWHFYVPETGSARNSVMKFDHGTARELSDLWSSWAAISREINKTRDDILRRRAARLWDAE